ncbi:MAG: hypothetical protein K2Q27_05950 [Novosphingobium sp.]|uniref:hypothetical protein n=1 Tax=Novosphingobium sp. NDB2Meth1 TaxID=1892847 RepID=UPI0011600C98|nr:hypothetical protein [Novosphingobium sp. NDB2Meth1]MBY0392790.1 hypothetical protein [Novosphingobium sp.]
MRRLVAVLLALAPAAALAQSMIPIRLVAGVNVVRDALGPGQHATINLAWRENGNAWGYDIYSVSVRGSIATIDGRDVITDQPHVGEDMIKSVRFARASFKGRPAIMLLQAERHIDASTYDPARTTISAYVLQRNTGGLGTTYEFVPIRRYLARRLYCNAEMALKIEEGLDLPRSYSGPMTSTGC